MHSDETHWWAFALVCREIRGWVLLGAKTHFHTVQTSCAPSEHELQGPSFSRKSSQRKQIMLSCNGNPVSVVMLLWMWPPQVSGQSRKQLVGGSLTGLGVVRRGTSGALTHVCWLRCWKPRGMSDHGWQKGLFCGDFGSSGSCL